MATPLTTRGQMSGAIPLFHAAWLFAVGIAATHWVWLPASFVLVAVAAMAAVCVTAALKAMRLAWLPMGVLWLLLGAWCALMEQQPAPSRTLDTASDGLMRTVEGTVVDATPVRTEVEQNVREDAQFDASARSEEPSQRVDVEVVRAEVVDDTEDRIAPADGRIRLTVRWPEGRPAALRCGERIRATVRLLRPEVYRDSGAWNRADFLLDEGITSTASVPTEHVERLGVSRVAAGCVLSNLQHDSAARLLTLPEKMRGFPEWLRMSNDDAVMLTAMATGDRTFLRHSLRVGFERTGSFHMLVVSGFHLAIIAACVFWLTRKLQIPRVPATLVTICASFAYALFTGFAVPVERACWMVMLYMVGRLLYRERSAMNALGFAALCLLAMSPRSLFDASLQMTLLAVVSIGGIAAPLLEQTVQRYLRAASDLDQVALDTKLEPKIAEFRVVLRMVAERVEMLAGYWIAWRAFPWSMRSVLRAVELVVVSVVVELAMTLPMAIYFHRITLFSLPVNVFLLPMLILLLPAALVTLVALAVWPGAAAVPGAATAAVLHVGVGLVHLFGSIRLSDVRIPDPALGQRLAFYALLGAAIVLARWSVARSNRAMRWLAAAALLLAALAGVAPRAVEHPRDALLVEAIDVGQGDALLLVIPDGKTLLVDAGGFGGGPRQAPQEFDIGEEVVAPALWARGIRRLDVVALSHAHSDHMGGMPAVLRDFHPAELWVGENPHVAAYDALLHEAAELGVRVRTLKAGDELAMGADRVNVLAPIAGYKPGSEPANNDSLVLRVRNGKSAVLLEGDAEAEVEQAMLAEPGLESTLLKAGHHGSKTSTTPEFLKRVAPQWAVISCGRRNRYGHPAMPTLEELEQAHVRTASTDIDGARCFELDGSGVRLEGSCGAGR
ncbi:MAG: ComEC/Rec2 family competence protein [Terracidiphilus sp.]|nr:ComEC/Rec2 family competence protein [Terracidiphilus sp.]